MMILVRKIILYFRKNSFSFFRSLEIYENRSSRVTSESLLKFESVLYNTSYNFTCTFSCTTEAHIRTHIHTHTVAYTHQTWRHTDIILQRCCYWYTPVGIYLAKVLYMAISHTTYRTENTKQHNNMWEEKFTIPLFMLCFPHSTCTLYATEYTIPSTHWLRVVLVLVLPIDTSMKHTHIAT